MKKAILWLALASTTVALPAILASRRPAPLPPRPDDDVVLPVSVEIWRPTIGNIPLDDQSRWEAVHASLQPGPGAGISELLHALHLYGRGARFEWGTGRDAPILDVVLCPDSCPRPDGLGASLFRTSSGARLARYDPARDDAGQEGTEAHRGQVLSVMAGLGIPLDREIRMPGGDIGTLRMIFEDMKAEFELAGEIYWDAIALAVYQPAGLAWQNRLGQSFSFDGLCEELLRRRPDDSSCAGTHRLIASAVLLRADAERKLLSPWIAARLRGTLAEASGHLARVQAEDGSWDQDWHRGLGGADHAELDDNPYSASTRLIATGHHIEWMLLMPEGVRPPRPVLERATRWLLDSLSQGVDKKPPKGRDYCAATHAARSIKYATGNEGASQRH
jgi:hypothetical protein